MAFDTSAKLSRRPMSHTGSCSGACFPWSEGVARNSTYPLRGVQRPDQAKQAQTSPDSLARARESPAVCKRFAKVLVRASKMGLESGQVSRLKAYRDLPKLSGGSNIRCHMSGQVSRLKAYRDLIFSPKGERKQSGQVSRLKAYRD